MQEKAAAKKKSEVNAKDNLNLISPGKQKRYL
jgi:hypothetical protein